MKLSDILKQSGGDAEKGTELLIKASKNQLMKVYVVIEEDRGMGADVQGVFQDKEQAEKLAEQSSHFFIEESVFHAMG